MATAIADSGKPAKLATRVPDRRFDRIFFSGMVLLIMATVFVGFARTYYLAGVFQAPLPSLIVHLHGAAFSCWIPRRSASSNMPKVRSGDRVRIR